MYGIPHGRGANLLMWNTDNVKPAPTSWGAVFDRPSCAVQGQGHGLRQPDLHRRRGAVPEGDQPDLKITNPYELDDKQFDAAVDLLKQQRQNIGEYWSDYTKEQAAFANGDSVVGTTWQVIANLLAADKVTGQDRSLPKEGATGWSDTWMISSKAKHPNCMYMWMNHIISPEGERRRWRSGSARRRRTARRARRRRTRTTAQIFHADDEAYFDKVAYWTTPTQGVRRRPRRRSARTTPSGSRPGRRSRADALTAVPASVAGRSAGRRLADLLHGRRRLQLGAAAGRRRSAGWSSPTSGSLAVLFVAAFWHARRVQRQDRPRLRPSNFQTLSNDPVYRTIVAADGGDRRAGDGHRRDARVPDRVLHGEGRVAARARRCSSSRC